MKSHSLRQLTFTYCLSYYTLYQVLIIQTIKLQTTEPTVRQILSKKKKTESSKKIKIAKDNVRFTHGVSKYLLIMDVPQKYCTSFIGCAPVRMKNI